MNVLFRILLCGAFVAAAFAQERPCTLNAVGDSVQLFACTGVKAESAQILEILNRIAADKLDPHAVLSKLAELPRGGGARSIELTELQRKNLGILAKQYPGQKIAVVYTKGDAAAAATAALITSILGSGGWLDRDGAALTKAVEYTTDKPFLGIEVLVNDHDLEDRDLPKAAVPLTLSLQAMGYARFPGGTPDVPHGVMQLRIGDPP